MRTLLVPERDSFGPQTRALFVFCGYHGDDARRRAGPRQLFRRIDASATAANARRVRDYYANPRDAAYMLEVARNFRRLNGLDGPADAVVDPLLAAAPIDAMRAEFAAVTMLDDGAVDASSPCWGQIRAQRHDAVVLLYPDAIGLGCSPIERNLLGMGTPLFVANGRRRAFALDGRARRALALRRFLSNTRVGEVGMAAVFLAAAAVFALVDAARPGRT